MAQSIERVGTSKRYATAIAETDRGSELERCIKHWDEMRIQRVGLLDEARGERHSVLLEIGNSGFPRYDYVRIDGFLLTSSFNAEVDVSGSALGKRLGEIYQGQSSGLRGRAGSEIDDGDCYYLTVNAGGTLTRVAV